MAVNGINASGTTGQPEKLGQTDAASRRPAAGRTGSGDKVELSPQARQISALSEAAAALPEIRSERVEELRLAIAEGTYRVDPKQVARAILDFEDAL